MTPLKEIPEITEPAQAELALAMAIVKYKPPSITVLDYLKTISDSITSLQGRPHATNKFFNSVKHWHHAYLESKAEQERLEKAIFELYCWKEAALAALPPAKRKALDDVDETLDADGKHTDGKRAKLDGVEDELQQDLVPQVPQVSQVTSNPKPEQGKSFLRCIAALEHAMKDPIPNDWKEREGYWKAIALKAVLVCKMAERGLLTVVRVELHLSQPGSSQENRQPSFIAVKNAVELAFRVVLRALHKIPVSMHEGAWRSQRQVIYYLVCLFESAMTALFEYSLITTEEKKEAVESAPGAEQQQNEAGGPSRASTGIQHEIAHGLVDLLCNMAISLNKKAQSDCPVIEGVLFLIIDRLGELLGYFTFDGNKLSINPNADVPPPAVLAAGREKMEMIDADAAQMEAKYLIFFLKRWLKEKPRFPFTHCNSPEAGSYELDKGIKYEMMKTLLQAIFGKGEPLFQGGLKRVATPEPDGYEEPPEQREEFSQWFIGELWALIGWDILEYPRPKIFTNDSAEEGNSAEREESSDSEDSIDSST